LGRKTCALEAPFWPGPDTPPQLRRSADRTCCKPETPSTRDAARVHPQIISRHTRGTGAKRGPLILCGAERRNLAIATHTGPWLNRQISGAMRRLTLAGSRDTAWQAHGLPSRPSPAKDRILTRARRDTDAETVPRVGSTDWGRNLANGLVKFGATQLAEIAQARAIADPCPSGCAMEAAQNTVSRPPRALSRSRAKSRPRDFSFTDVEKLRRDPYHIYARSHPAPAPARIDLHKTPDCAVARPKCCIRCLRCHARPHGTLCG